MYIIRFTPSKNLPTIKKGIDSEAYNQNEPPVNKKSDIMIQIFLPYLSENVPTQIDPMAPPIAVIEIIS